MYSKLMFCSALNTLITITLQTWCSRRSARFVSCGS